MSAATGWDEPLPAVERDALLGAAADAILRRGLAVPAVFALEMNRPLSFLASQSLIGLAPLLAPVLGIERMQRLARLLAEPGSVAELIRRLEEGRS